MDIHDIINAIGHIYQKVYGSDNEIEKCFLILGTDLDEGTWKDYTEALAKWQALKEDVEYTMQMLKKYGKYLEEMGYDEDIDDDEE